MTQDKKYMEQILSDQQTADFLRQLASGIEKGSLDFNETRVLWDEVNKIKITFKNQGNQVVVKTKLKSDPPANTEIDLEYSPEPDKTEPGKTPSGSYKSLKKRMKKTFKNILAYLHKDVMPDSEIFESFVLDCRAMTGYSGYGDEYYADFLKEIQSMEQAFSKQDMPLTKESAARINHFMKDCHDRYK